MSDFPPDLTRLSVYLPMDRRQALAAARAMPVEHPALPDRAFGAVLFADVSGFTALAERLVRNHGPLRGAEELTWALNQVYEALIGEVDRHGGSVINFAGDAVTCWFDEAPPSPALLDQATFGAARAVACALAMQRAVESSAILTTPVGEQLTLGMKVGVASGQIRRFLVGDPTIRQLDILAGATVDRVGQAGRLAARGEVLIDRHTFQALSPAALVREWRQEGDDPERYGVLEALVLAVPETPWPPLAAELDEAQLRPWFLPTIYERLRRSLPPRYGRETSPAEELLAELRPAVSLFLRFQGIPYDMDPAGELLDHYLRWVQTVLARYQGTLLDLSIGDKGSYLYAVFGVPVAHSDDATRAIAAALELRDAPAPSQTVGIGISQGQFWVGAYGGQTSRTFGVLGDEVNVTARLMEHARGGQILVSQRVRQSTGERFLWERLAPIHVKGRDAVVPVSMVVGARHQRAVRLQSTIPALPLVGRSREVVQLQRAIDRTLAGQGQIVAIQGDAGLGKSRLVAEAVALASNRWIPGYGSECQAFGMQTAYHGWHTIWRAFFGVEPTWSIEDQLSVLSMQLELIDPALRPRLPLLGVALNESFPDNDLTASMDARLRKTSLESLLVTCLRQRATSEPLFLVLEDCQWLDPLSHDLLEVIGRAIAGVPILIILTYRPLEEEGLPPLRVSELPTFMELTLEPFAPAEAEALVQKKLEQGAFVQQLSPALLGKLMERAGGNPFFLEELVGYLTDRGGNTQTISDHLDLPATLQHLLLSRIDLLSESQRLILKAASIVGRHFPVSWLWGVHPDLGERRQVKADLEAMSRLGLIVRDAPDPHPSYLFKHVMTQEVVYESMPFGTRARLHEQLAAFLEWTARGRSDHSLDLLAFHYSRSPNVAKQREYLRRAGEAAQAAYANDAAIAYYEQLLPLLSPEEQGPIILRLARVFDVVGRWPEAEAYYNQILTLPAQTEDDELLHGQALQALGGLFRSGGNYPQAIQTLNAALTRFQALAPRRDALAGSAVVLTELGAVHHRQGENQSARRFFEEALVLSTESGDQMGASRVLMNIGNMANDEGDHETARAYYEESLALRRTLGDRAGVAALLNNLGNVAEDQHNRIAARALYEESLSILRQIGHTWGIAILMNNLGVVTYMQGDYAHAEQLFAESLAMRRIMGDRFGMAQALNNLGLVAYRVGDPDRALGYLGQALPMLEGNPRVILCALVSVMATVAPHQPELAVRLRGVVDANTEALSINLDTAYHDLQRETEPLLRGRLPPDEWHAAWEGGRALSVEQARQEVMALYPLPEDAQESFFSAA